MTETIFTRDSPTKLFDGVEQDGITADDSGDAELSWDEIPIVKVDAPADLEGAFDTDRFYKIEDATIARPIKQQYQVADDTETYVKPANELQNAAWSFDNAPYTLGHPDTGMVKDVNDIHGFWRNVSYDSDSERLTSDLYIPESDSDAKEFVEQNQDVSVGFWNRVYESYTGEKGNLVDDTDDVDGYQVDIYGNHIAGVEHGRCSSEHGCGLDNRGTMQTLNADSTTAFLTEEDETESDDVDKSEKVIRRIERQSDEKHGDAPAGIHVAEDGTWLAVGPDEHMKDGTEHPDDGMFPVDSCADVDDAYQLRGHTDNLTIDKSTLEERIKRVDDAMDCGVIPENESDSSCNCSNTTMENDFDIPDLSIDALTEQNDKVAELKEERDEYEEALDELRDELDLSEDECPCDAVPALKEQKNDARDTVSDVREALDVDEDADLVDRVETIADEWEEFRTNKHDEKLDEVASLGAERDEWDDATIDELETEIERRKEVLDTVDETSPTGIETDESDDDDTDTTVGGRRRFGRGYASQ